nr:hypothetical protein [Tanacetum cinerariifolium]
MATTIEQQVVLDEAFILSTKRLRIRRSNFRLPSDIQSKEPTLNTKASKEYYACATREAAPKPKVSARRKRSDSDTSITPPTATPTPIKTVAAAPRLTAAAKGKQPAKAKSPYDPSEVKRTEAEQLKIVLRRSKQETHISQHGGSSTDEGTVKDRNDDEGDQNDKSDYGKEEDDDDDQDDAKRDDDDDDNDDEEEIAKIDEPKIQRVVGVMKKNLNVMRRVLKKKQGLRVSEEQRIIEEEEADELYRDQESSSASSFVTSMLNPIRDAGVESIFTTALSSVAPLPTPTPTMTPSIITTITTASHPPIPPTPFPSEVLQNLPTFDSMFRFNERLKSLEASFSEYMQTNPFAEYVSNIPDEQRNLYKALVDAYEANKTILESYGGTTILKRRREDDDDQEGPSAGSDRGSKRRREGEEPESASTPSEPATRSASRSTTGTQSRQMSASESSFVEEPVQTTYQMDEPSHLVFETGAEDQPIVQTSQHPEWFSQPRKPPTPDRDWNKTLPAIQGSAQTWISELAKQADSRSSFNELLDTPIDFSNFIMNWLYVDTLSPELLAGPTYELMRGSCNSLTELEYHLEEVYKATTDQLDWVNPEGQQYPHNLLQPLLLIPDNRGRRVIPFAHFINNDLEYLWGGASSRKYTTSVTKTKAADLGTSSGLKTWGRKRQQFYRFAVNQESALDVYSKRRIIAVTDFKIVEWHNYKHLDWISVHHDNGKIYKFKEGNFKRLRLQDIEDMLLLLVQGKLSNLTVEERFAFNVSLRMFTRSIVIQRRGEQASAGTPSEKATKGAGGSTTGTQSRQQSASESAYAEEPVQTTCQMEETSLPVYETGEDDQPIVHTSQHPKWKEISPFSDQMNNRTCIRPSLTPMKQIRLFLNLMETQPFGREDVGIMMIRKDPPLDQTGGRRDEEKMSASESAFAEEPVQTTYQMDESPHLVLETGAEDQPIVQNSQHPEWKPPTPDRDWNKTLPAVQGSAQIWISELAKQADSRSSFNELLDTPIDFSNFIMNRLCESALDVYSKRRIIVVTDLKIVEWHNYKHLDWISLSNLTVEERFAFNVSLRMFTRSIVIQRRVEDLQLGVESYQKMLNLTKLDTYRSDLKRREAYTAYSNLRGFIYQNKDKKNRLMRIVEIHKFSDGTLNDVRNAIDDRLKGIRMQYLPQTIWRKGDKDRAAAMIQAIDKMLKTRRIMRSLERFVGGRLYEGDF